MMKKTIFFLLISCPFLGISQTISGIILDQNQKPIDDVRIYSIKKKLHSHTTKNGEFTIQIEVNDTLELDKKGYDTKLIAVSENTTTLNIELKEEPKMLNKVTISDKNDLVNDVTNVKLENMPNRSSQELLSLVPGLFIAQHAGGGKAEQMFLRGFDIDHGTDVNVAVDGVTANMVSHAHGQGYTDLHFLIPNLVSKIEFSKGSYNLKKGNLATAGYVDFITKDRLDQNTISLGYGMFNSKDLYGGINILNEKNHSIYVAGQTTRTDGYFTSSQRFIRDNIALKYFGRLDNTTLLRLNVGHFNSSWDASGQIPTRSVASGQITRFGAIDDTEGGFTSRQTSNIELAKYFEDNSVLKTKVFYNHYNFELYSNFTFFARDSINGDQIRQKEKRDNYGFLIDYEKNLGLEGVDAKILAGIGSRFDLVKNIELSYTKNRTETLDKIQFGDVNETNYSAYLGTEIIYKNIKLNGGVRAEELIFDYLNKLDSTYNPKTTSSYAFLPKINLSYTINKKLNVFAKWGTGFHSNDTRLIIENPDYTNLPLATSYDIGFNLSPVKNLFLSFSYWNMKSQQEFVYVGDEGIVEPNGESVRNGIDLALSYQVKEFAFFNFNINYVKARYTVSEEFVPLAPPLTMTGSALFYVWKKMNINWSARFMSDRPADESNTIIAKGYFVNDLTLGWKEKSWQFLLSVDNILNTEWNETQFLTESKLKDESVPVEEIHFTPGRPRFIRGTLIFNF